MGDVKKDRRLQVAWITFAVLSVVSMAYSVVIATTPLLGEEEFAGTSFAQLRVTNPRIADVIWHDTVAFGIVAFGVSFLGFVLAWKGLSRGSRLAWYSLLIIAVTYLGALLFAHVPIGNTSPAHLGAAYVIFPTYLVALAISMKPVFSASRQA